jgi:very-short-patch-repair endonuclease
MASDGDVARLAEEQFGAVSRGQMAKAGLSAEQIRTRVAAGRLSQLSHRVFAVNGSVDSFERRGRAVLLDSPPASGLSLSTAAAWYGVPGFALEPIHVSEPRDDRSRRSRVDAERHHPIFLPVHHLVVVNGLAVTTPTRTAADIAHIPKMHPKRAARAVEWLWSHGLTDRGKLARMADEWCERGRRGSAFLKEFLEARPTEFRPPESNLERRFIEIITEAGFPPPRRQVNVGDEEAWFGRCDLLDPELPLIAEIDSDTFHTAPLDVAADEERDAKATRAGFEVVRVKEFDVWHNPSKIIQEWRDRRRLVRRAG